MIGKLLDTLADWIGKGIDWEYFAVNTGEYVAAIFAGAQKYRITVTAVWNPDSEYGITVTGWREECERDEPEAQLW